MCNITEFSIVPLTRKISNFTAGNHAADKIPSQTPFSIGQEVAMGLA